MIINYMGAKLITFLLLPMYTRFLTPAEYGTIDIMFTLESILLPVITLNINSSVLRYSINQDRQKHVFSTGFYTTLKGISFLFILIVALGLKTGSIILLWFFLLIASDALNLLLSSFIKGINRLKIMVLSSLLSSLTTCGVSIYLIAYKRLGIAGYFGGIITGYIISGAVLSIFAQIKYYLIMPKKVDGFIKRKMIQYSTPLVLNQISWMINSSADKLLIRHYLGTTYNGLYAIALKPSIIINLLQTVLAQAWILSAIKEYRLEKTRIEFFSKMLEFYTFITFVTASSLMICNIIFSFLIYTGEFQNAWPYAPLLIFASSVCCLGYYFSAILEAVQDTKSLCVSTVISAFINILLNILLIPHYGIVAACWTTIVSYAVVTLIRYYKAINYIMLNKTSKTRCLYAFLMIFIQTLIATLSINSWKMQIMFLLMIFYIYRNIIIKMHTTFLTFMKGNN